MTRSVSHPGPEPIELIVSPEDAGLRLDVYLAQQFPRYSRVRLRRAINAAMVQVDGHCTKAALHLKDGQQVSIRLPEPTREGPLPEDIPLDILYEDNSIVVVNKPPGMVVHPAKGHWQGTLASALAFHFQSLSTLGGPARPGIVHRLDRETSGVILVAKTNEAHLALARQFEQRLVNKQYLAVVSGNPDRDRDIIEKPIGMHPYHREKMAVRAGHSTSRPARTFFEVEERFDRFAALHVMPKTGRTHQIRVHLAHLGHAVLCDRLYGGRSSITLGEVRQSDEPDVLLDRLALHARKIRLTHPLSQEPVEFEAPLPDDISRLLEELRLQMKKNTAN